MNRLTEKANMKRLNTGRLNNLALLRVFLHFLSFKTANCVSACKEIIATVFEKQGITIHYNSSIMEKKILAFHNMIKW